MLQAVTNKHSLVESPTVRSTLHGRLITVFVTSFARPVIFDSQLLDQNRIAISAYTPPAFDAPVGGVPVGIPPSRLARKN